MASVASSLSLTPSAMVPTGYRFIEACALLPMLFVPADRENSVMCTGAQAETLAAHALRWRDVKCVYLREKPIRPLSAPNDPILKDKRIVITATPPVGSCSAVLTTPGEDPDAFLSALTADGIICVSRYEVTEVQPMLWHLRRLFPRTVLPWRDHIPQELYGALASPRGLPQRRREPPTSARRLSPAYIRNLLTFARDEMPLVFGTVSGKTDKTSATKGSLG